MCVCCPLSPLLSAFLFLRVSQFFPCFPCFSSVSGYWSLPRFFVLLCVLGCSSLVFPLFSGFSPLFSPLIFLFLFWVYFSVLSPQKLLLVLFFLLSFSALCSGFSSPFYRETCPSTSPAFAGLLFKSRTGSWARDVVHDLLQISC